MEGSFAGHDAACRRRCPVAMDGCRCRDADGGVLVEAQIIIGREVDDRASPDLRSRTGAPLVGPEKGIGDSEDIRCRALLLQLLVAGESLEAGRASIAPTCRPLTTRGPRLRTDRLLDKGEYRVFDTARQDALSPFQPLPATLAGRRLAAPPTRAAGLDRPRGSRGGRR